MLACTGSQLVQIMACHLFLFGTKPLLAIIVAFIEPSRKYAVELCIENQNILFNAFVNIAYEMTAISFEHRCTPITAVFGSLGYHTSTNCKLYNMPISWIMSWQRFRTASNRLFNSELKRLLICQVCLTFRIALVAIYSFAHFGECLLLGICACLVSILLWRDWLCLWYD